MVWNGNTFGRIDIGGSIEVRNNKTDAVELEISRNVMGLVSSVGQGGTQTQKDLAAMWGEMRVTTWWSWFSWSSWWFRFNGFGEFRWTVQIPAGSSTTLDAAWHYYWR